MQYKMEFKRKKLALILEKGDEKMMEHMMSYCSINVVYISEKFLKSDHFFFNRMAKYFVKKGDTLYRVAQNKELIECSGNFKDLHFVLDIVQCNKKGGDRVSTSKPKSKPKKGKAKV